MSTQKKDAHKPEKKRRAEKENKLSGYLPIALLPPDKEDLKNIAIAEDFDSSALGRKIILRWKKIYHKNRNAAMRFLVDIDDDRV